MKPYEWMVKYTPQKEWIEGQGIFLWLAFYVGGLGGGLYLVSLYFNSMWGMLVSWVIVAVLKGGFHLLYLGKPLRFWRILAKPQTSWISRGFIFVAGFIVFGALQFITSHFYEGSSLELILKVITSVMAFGEAIYTGFAMNYINGIPFWNSALIPLLFILYGVLGGLAVLMGIMVIHGDVSGLVEVEAMSRVLMIVGAVALVIYLWSATYMGATARASVRELMVGRIALIFWIGLVILGIAIPIGVSLLGIVVELSTKVMIGAVVSEIIGGLSLRYCLLKGGGYSPLIPNN